MTLSHPAHHRPTPRHSLHRSLHPSRPHPLRSPLLLRIVAGICLLTLLATALSTALAYSALRHDLLSHVDSELAQATRPFEHGTGEVDHPGRSQPAPGQRATYVQVFSSTGVVYQPANEPLSAPFSSTDLAVAGGTHSPYWHTVETDGTNLRIYTAPLTSGYAVRTAIPLTGVDAELHHLLLSFLLTAFFLVLLSLVLSLVVARRILTPVRTLTSAVDEITATRSLASRIPVESRDELGVLAARFNTMLEELSSSLLTQRQLVADASHELRTPLASLRTNVEVLQRFTDIPAADREELLASILAETEELTHLIADVSDLARGEDAPLQLHALDLAELVETQAERFRHYHPSTSIFTSLEPFAMEGDSTRLARLVGNLLDNATKFTSSGVEVTLSDGVLSVRDHGPGIPEEDLPHVTKRFFRSASSRSAPGSGLGLAIVAQAAEAHHAHLSLQNAEDGGLLAQVDFSSSCS